MRTVFGSIAQYSFSGRICDPGCIAVWMEITVFSLYLCHPGRADLRVFHVVHQLFVCLDRPGCHCGPVPSKPVPLVLECYGRNFWTAVWRAVCDSVFLCRRMGCCILLLGRWYPLRLDPLCIQCSADIHLAYAPV